IYISFLRLTLEKKLCGTKWYGTHFPEVHGGQRGLSKKFILVAFRHANLKIKKYQIYRVFQNEVSTLKSPAKIRHSTHQVETYLEYIFHGSDLLIKILSFNWKYKQIKERTMYHAIY
ncbi:MAG: hypothetical protein O7C62_00010, partial [Rickettsia endosymbiont of Ixodes persulcatus]|nr:hypothetical protein [Rickettsia endosymbiont of Ixodes persulcatus]